MINLLTMSRFQKPKASTIGTPIFHRKRRSWQDDKDLMLELHSFLSKPDGPYDYFENKVTQFRSKIDSFIDSGFEDNIEVFFLAMWVREQLSALTIQKGSYNLSVDPLELPENVDDIISKEESKTTMRGSGKSLDISISDLFPNPKLRAFCARADTDSSSRGFSCLHILIGSKGKRVTYELLSEHNGLNSYL